MKTLAPGTANAFINCKVVIMQSNRTIVEKYNRIRIFYRSLLHIIQ